MLLHKCHQLSSCGAARLHLPSQPAARHNAAASMAAAAAVAQLHACLWSLLLLLVLVLVLLLLLVVLLLLLPGGTASSVAWWPAGMDIGRQHCMGKRRGASCLTRKWNIPSAAQLHPKVLSAHLLPGDRRCCRLEGCCCPLAQTGQ